MSVGSWFEEFCKNIKFDDKDLENLRYRYRQITKRINLEFWNSTSEELHSLYVGSYGRGTATHLSDIDMIVILPYATYQRINNRQGNKQSALLQEVKTSLQRTYSTSHIKADGQVVGINFSDGINFEIVPVFENTDGSYLYPDTNDGGSWKKTNPKKEIDEMNTYNNLTNGNLKKLCKMLREWKDEKNVNISGYAIDTLAYNFIKYWENKDKSYTYYDWMTRDFFKYLSEQNEDSILFAPGSYNTLYIGNKFNNKANTAYEKAKEAIADETKYPSCAKSEWREIYGTKFPN
jgi:hypothetical protein